ncbi:transcription factor ORG2-like [Mangifera indica]|uniref:transcription factor ORG2-like n=1 Tax=Mangifera indica TaxID=29780 RepID=UPI001CF930AA|nr:transcription factor ORG2-like [Mangifera indica]
MSAVYPVLQSLGWPLEEVTRQQQQQHKYMCGDTDTVDSIPYGSAWGDPSNSMAKKLYHNASERDRRKRINTLYSSLRSLLPPSDQAKKLSIPTTVSRVLKHIPDLQQQVERLIQKKEELLSRISKQGALIHQEDQIKNSAANSLSSISATRLNDNEVAVHISTYALHKCHLSRILFSLEEDGLRPINASSFESFGGRVFYNLHLQVERSYKLDSEVLSDKLLSLYENREEMFS